jgi:hypothetical protein
VARALAQRVAGAPRSAVSGRFERHVSANRRQLTGSNAGGRWGAPGSYVVLYLGRPRASVAVEAYRHLVDPFAEQGMTGAMVAPRRLLICDVSVSEVLDLRSKDALLEVGLTERDLRSDIGDYAACQAVGRVAHQLELHGVLAPRRAGWAKPSPSSSSTCPQTNSPISWGRKGGTDFPQIPAISVLSETMRKRRRPNAVPKDRRTPRTHPHEADP